MGIIASTIANCHRAPHTKAFAPRDFVPKFDTKPTKPQSIAEMKQTVALINETLARRPD